MPAKPLLLALDFGGTKLAAALAPAGEDRQGGSGRDMRAGGWLVHEEAPSPPGRTAQSDMRIMMELVGRLLAAAQGPLAAIGISFGGPVAAGRRVVLLSHHVPGWEQMPLCDRLEAELGAAAFMDNDGNTAALGEYRYGAGRGHGSLLYITVSTGVGGGWILNGQSWGGADGIAGEIGHMVVDPQGPACPCGKRGCVEVMASGLGIAQRAGEWLAARPDDGAVLRSLAADSSALDAELVARAAALGDELAWQALEVSARALGNGIGDAANLMNPELFVLGGGVTKAGDRWWQAVRQAARDTALPEIRTEIEPAALGDDAPLWGAIALAQDGIQAQHPERRDGRKRL
jgi:glucokinase